MNNIEVLEKIKKLFDEELISKNDPLEKFSEDVINLAYQKLSANIMDLISNEEDPMVINEILQNFLSVTKSIDERGLSKKQLILKYFEQISKYEQSKYY